MSDEDSIISMLQNYAKNAYSSAMYSLKITESDFLTKTIEYFG